MFFFELAHALAMRSSNDRWASDSAIREILARLPPDRNDHSRMKLIATPSTATRPIIRNVLPPIVCPRLRDAS